MTITYTHGEGSQSSKPSSVDTASSCTAVYLRKHIEQITRTDENTGETYTLWSYEEAKIKPSEYTTYLAEDTASKVEYLAMMADIDFDEEEDDDDEDDDEDEDNQTDEADEA